MVSFDWIWKRREPSTGSSRQGSPSTRRMPHLRHFVNRVCWQPTRIRRGKNSFRLLKDKEGEFPSIQSLIASHTKKRYHSLEIVIKRVSSLNNSIVGGRESSRNGTKHSGAIWIPLSRRLCHQQRNQRVQGIQLAYSIRSTCNLPPISRAIWVYCSIPNIRHHGSFEAETRRCWTSSRLARLRVARRVWSGLVFISARVHGS